MSEIRETLTERAQTHGDYHFLALVTQMIKRLMRDTNGWEKLTVCQRESLEMIAHKIGRILAGNPDYRDHWIDIAGYAQLVADDFDRAGA